ncbi:hypothetical protein ACGFMM_34210 [Streptomyces sp. NPDC048604]|uniref:hypothetical protein n=1 Tax=Streptomyces sp. NPDC048604 TaxID=3365578 RepID=UPI0037191313
MEAWQDASDDDRFVFGVGEEQFHLLRRGLIVYLATEEHPVARSLVLGPGGRESLEGALQAGAAYADVVPGPLSLTFEDVRGLHAMLLTLATFHPASEQDFVERAGYFRETVRQMASLLVWALRGAMERSAGGGEGDGAAEAGA